MTVARHLVIHGRVQGVFYRGWAVQTARALGLSGWVRNRRDGTVEAVIEGEQEAVERFIERSRDGPTHAQVDRIETTDLDPGGNLGEFSQRPTV